MTTTGRRRAVGFVLCALLAAAAGLVAQAGGALRGAEQRSIAVRFGVRPAQRPADVLVVGVDDATFESLRRQWPFPRTMHARVIDRLRRAGARGIVYDVQFTEPSAPRQDLALYDAVARARGVVLATTEWDDEGHTNVLGGDENLARAHARAGAANLPESVQGVLDRIPYAIGPVRSLAVTAAAVAGAPAPSREAFGRDGARIDFRGPPGTIRTVSFADVLQGRVPASAIRGRVVVVGATAPTLQDFHPTPTAARPMSGPEIQANAIWTAMHGLPLRDAPAPAGVLLVVAFAVAAPLLRVRLRVLPSVVGALVIGAAGLAAAQVAFDHGVVVWVSAPLLALWAGTVAMVVDSHLAETAARRRAAEVNELLEARVRERTRELRDTQLEILQRLARAAEWRDEDTGTHLQRIGTLTHRLALAAGLDPDEAEMLMHASTAHDIGKVAIPDRVLHKPGRLDADELAVMRDHAAIGSAMLAGSRAPLLQLAETIAGTHHERWDGTGYPKGLRGQEIPLAGRICALCDVYDALVSKRCYKPAWTPEDALAELRAGSGTHFDPGLVELFVDVARASHDELYGTPQPAAPVAAPAPAGAAA